MINSAHGYSKQSEPTPSAIPGLRYIPDYITTEYEADLVATIDRQPWLTDLRRQVQHYGYRYDYKARSVSRELYLGPLPEWLTSLCQRLQDERFSPKLPDQVIVNEYQPGQGIAPHIDCVPCFGETIASLSLGSACVMDFTRCGEKIPMLLEPRSLVILSGDARYQWKHAIAPRKTDPVSGELRPRSRRISLTFRNVKLTKTDDFS